MAAGRQETPKLAWPSRSTSVFRARRIACRQWPLETCIQSSCVSSGPKMIDAGRWSPRNGARRRSPSDCSSVSNTGNQFKSQSDIAASLKPNHRIMTGTSRAESGEMEFRSQNSRQDGGWFGIGSGNVSIIAMLSVTWVVRLG